MSEDDTVFGQYFDDRKVCELLSISQRTLNNKVCRSPTSLPKFVRPMGCRKRMWPIADFEKWLSESAKVRDDNI